MSTVGSGIVWEYTLLYHAGPAPLDWLNERGAEGWEVVLAQPLQEERGMIALQTAGHYWLFKRMRVSLQHVTVLPREMAAGLQGNEEGQCRLAPALAALQEWREGQEPEAVRDEGLQRVDGMVKRTRKGWSEEARARARERGKAQAAARKVGQPTKWERELEARRDAEVEGNHEPGVSGALGDESTGA